MEAFFLRNWAALMDASPSFSFFSDSGKGVLEMILGPVRDAPDN